MDLNPHKTVPLSSTGYPGSSEPYMSTGITGPISTVEAGMPNSGPPPSGGYRPLPPKGQPQPGMGPSPSIGMGMGPPPPAALSSSSRNYNMPPTATVGGRYPPPTGPGGGPHPPLNLCELSSALKHNTCMDGLSQNVHVHVVLVWFMMWCLSYSIVRLP